MLFCLPLRDCIEELLNMHPHPLQRHFSFFSDNSTSHDAFDIQYHHGGEGRGGGGRLGRNMQQYRRHLLHTLCLPYGISTQYAEPAKKSISNVPHLVIQSFDTDTAICTSPATSHHEIFTDLKCPPSLPGCRSKCSTADILR